MKVSDHLIQISFVVPELRQLPRLVGSCCMLPVDFLIEETLREVEQVHDVVVSEEEGVVRVWIVGAVSELKEELIARIEDLGFRVDGIDLV